MSASASQRTYVQTRTTAKLAGRRFLVVEDEPLVALDIVPGLQEAGAEVVASTAAQQEIKRTDLQHHDLSVSGREVIQTRVDIAPEAAFPRHKHPGEEIIYVIARSNTSLRTNRP